MQEDILSETNARGKRLLQFCGINQLKIANTMYKHKKLQLVTWISPNCITQNQIDYFLLQKNNLGMLKDCRVFDSADIGSDHSLVMAKVIISSKPRKRLKV